MEAPSLVNFLATKERFKKEGFKFFWIFDIFYLKELKELYEKKMLALEDKLERIEENPPKKLGDFLMCGHTKKKFEDELVGIKIIHVGSSEGFSMEDLVFVDKEHTKSSKLSKSQRFHESFKNIILNQRMIPDKSCILLTVDQCRLLKSGRSNSKLGASSYITGSMMKRKQLSQIKGQKVLTDFFQSTKSPSVKLPYRKPEDPPKNALEEIIQKLRGDNVKVLLMPKLHYELDSSQYVSVFLLNEISLLVESDEDADLKAHCIEAVNRLPNGIWELAVKYVNDCEEIYLKCKEDSEAKLIVKSEKGQEEESD